MIPDQFVATRKKERRLTVLVVLAIVVAVISFALAACNSVTDHRGASSSSSDASGGGSAKSSPGTGKSAGNPPSTSKKSGGSPGAEDGVLPDNASPLDTSLPGISKLDPKLLHAVQEAAKAAEESGISIHVTTGWRSKEYQRELMKKAIKKYGSEEKARKYVSSPEDSHHVTGNAVDLGPTDADDWVNRKGARFGLCQTLANEMWHFELATTPGGKCPPMTGTADTSN